MGELGPSAFLSRCRVTRSHETGSRPLMGRPVFFLFFFFLFLVLPSSYDLSIIFLNSFTPENESIIY